MKKLTVKIPDDKLEWFKELLKAIGDLKIVEVEHIDSTDLSENSETARD
jgi:hypothetical protein